MQFPTPLVPARLIRRYKRFFADLTLEDGTEVTAHCPNTGPMTGLVDPGTRCWIEPNDDPKKKLNYGWRLVDHENGHFTGVDTGVPNKVLRAALESHQVPELSGYATVRPEVKYAENSRIDFLLTGEGAADIYVEVKSVTLRRSGTMAEFPDTVTTRGTKHMGDLAQMARIGHRAVLFYLVQRTDCDRVAVAGDIDPNYAKAVQNAMAEGVKVIAYSCAISPDGVILNQALRFIDAS